MIAESSHQSKIPVKSGGKFSEEPGLPPVVIVEDREVVARQGGSDLAESPIYSPRASMMDNSNAVVGIDKAVGYCQCLRAAAVIKEHHLARRSVLGKDAVGGFLQPSRPI
jgi:hypothetical protein